MNSEVWSRPIWTSFQGKVNWVHIHLFLICYPRRYNKGGMKEKQVKLIVFQLRLIVLEILRENRMNPLLRLNKTWAKSCLEAWHSEDLWKDERRQKIVCNRLKVSTTHTHTRPPTAHQGCTPIVYHWDLKARKVEKTVVLHVALRLFFDILPHLPWGRWLWLLLCAFSCLYTVLFQSILKLW